MSQQPSKQRKTTSKKTQSKKGSNDGLLILLLIVVLIIAVVFFVVRGNNGSSNSNSSGSTTSRGSSKTDTTTQESSKAKAEYGQIDFNNTENAKVEDGVKQNTSERLLADKTFKNMDITNIQLKAEGGMSRFTATLKNNTSDKYQSEEITIVFLKADGTELARLKTITPSVSAGQSNEIDAATTADITNAYDFRIE